MNFPEAIRIICAQCGEHTKCKACPVLRTVEEYDAGKYEERQINLIRSMSITPVNNWYIGTISGYSYQVKVSSEKSPWGISGGRIIKLFVTEMPTDDKPGKEEIITYERGWSTYPSTTEHEEILDALYEYFQNHCEVEV